MKNLVGGFCLFLLACGDDETSTYPCCFNAADYYCPSKYAADQCENEGDTTACEYRHVNLSCMQP